MALSRPATISISVDFPQPDGPSSEMRLTALDAEVDRTERGRRFADPKTFCTPRSSIQRIHLRRSSGSGAAWSCIRSVDEAVGVERRGIRIGIEVVVFLHQRYHAFPVRRHVEAELAVGIGANRAAPA